MGHLAGSFLFFFFFNLFLLPEIANLIVAFVNITRFGRGVCTDRMHLARRHTIDCRNAVCCRPIAAVHTIVVPKVVVRAIYQHIIIV